MGNLTLWWWRRSKPARRVVKFVLYLLLFVLGPSFLSFHGSVTTTTVGITPGPTPTTQFTRTTRVTRIGTPEPWLVITDGTLRFYPFRWSALCGLVALSTIAVLVCIQTLETRRLRLISGLCPACGYDLRATPDRCPECGTTAS